HFHCRGGKGRSGSAIFIYDVIKNKHAYPLSVIVERTKQFGITKSIFTPNPKKPEKLKHAQNRKKFLEAFYKKYSKKQKTP
ncbi:MAG: hypothetical protein Q8K36_02305, partial [Alphaproteobacteria bacterium]|nr:hypothetical protein [Alphaproteobacteria bacterium]